MLSIEFLTEKIKTLKSQIETFPNEFDYSIPQKEHLQRLLNAYESEYVEALKRGFPPKPKEEPIEYKYNLPGETTQVRVRQYTLEGELVGEYKSLSQASRVTGIGYQNIGKTVRGLRYTAGGYVWKRA